MRHLTRFLISVLLGCSCILARAQTNWTAIRSSTPNNLWGVCYGGGQFVAVGENGTILTSPDGLVWTPRASGTNVWLTSVAYGFGNYIAVGSDGVILFSYDGIAWENATARETVAPTDRLNVVSFVDDHFVAYGEHGRAIVITLPVRLDGLERRTSSTGTWWRAFASGRDRYVVGGETGLAILRTGDPFMVEPLPVTVPANVRNVSGLVFDGDAFVAVGAAGTIVTSADASTWTLVPSPTTANLQALATFNNTLVAVGENGTILSRDENGLWQRRNAPTAELLLGVAASDAAAVVIGGSGTILRSTATPAAPKIISPPGSVQETLGGAASFTVRASGSLPLTYQWYRDGTPLPGETRAELIRAPLTVGDAGRYTVIVTNAAGSVVSPEAIVTPLPAPAPVVDESFRADAALDGLVRALLPLADGSAVVATTGVLRNDGVPCRVRKLRPDGALDLTWRESTFAVTDPNGFASVSLLTLQSEGKILVGGSFDLHNGQPRPNLLRLNADGSLDAAFSPAAEATVRPIIAIALQPDGRIVLANNGPTPLQLLVSGTLDPNFHPSPQPQATLTSPILSRDRLIQRVATTRDGKIYSAGVANLQITLIQGRAPDTRLERLNADGTPDAAFPPLRWPGGILALRELDDGSLLAIQEFAASPDGRFFSTNGRVARFLADGTAFPQHQNPTLSQPRALYLYSDGRVLSAGAQFPNPIRLTALGAIDPAFTGGTGSPFAIAATADGHVLVGGDFTLYDGRPANRVARLNAVPNETVNAPRILRLVPDRTAVGVGQTITLRAAVVGSAQLTFDWDGVMTATGTPLRTASPVLNFSFPSAGTRRVQLTVRNNHGVATSEPITLAVVPSPPVVTGQPRRVSAQSGREVTLSISINSDAAGNCTFDWYRNGQPLTTRADYNLHLPSWYLPNVTAADAGTYTVVVRNAGGLAVTSAPIELTIDDSSRLANLSTRVSINDSDQSVIAGFVVSGNRARTVLIRGIGPGLAKLGVPNALADPQIALFDSSGRTQIISSNDDWSGNALQPAFEQTGAFALEPGSKDAAIITTLSPGGYSVQLTGKPGNTGSALVEIYEADNVADRMLNLSTRATISAGSPAIAGFSIQGLVEKRVLLRAVGPALAAFGVASPLANPRIDLRNTSGATLAGNDDWETNNDRAALTAAMTAAGAFPFATGSRDAALLVTLAPGNYTAIVDGVGGASGVALIEVYEVP